MTDLKLFGDIFQRAALGECLGPLLQNPDRLSKSFKTLKSAPFMKLIEVPGINPWLHEQTRQSVIEEVGEEAWILILSPDSAILIDRARIWNPRCYAELYLAKTSPKLLALLQWLGRGPAGLERCRKKSEALCPSIFVRGKAFESKLKKSKRKKRGAFFTPEWLARRMVYETLASGSVRSSSEIQSLRILDPSMGAGHFLLVALDALAWGLCCAWSKENRLSSI
ncbi:MAG: hypothetical protein P1V97_27655, partial [Planctomycetota bacterium]|nr:hypothetical protein [Planctomycetota bacterium]